MKKNLFFMGDVCFGFNNNEVDDKYAENFMKDIRGEITDSDYLVANLENSLTDYTVPIKKIGPNLRGTPQNIAFLQAAGIDCAILANNHIGDFGVQGIEQTITQLDQFKISYVGAGSNIEEAYEPVRVLLSEAEISIIAVCENEFGIAGGNEAGAAGYHAEKLKHKIVIEKEMNRKVIVVYHGGNEFCPLPSPDIKMRLHQMADAGASAVILIHTHCPGGYEIYNEVPIFYGIGNFCFYNDNIIDPTSTWFWGHCVRLSIENNKIKHEIYPYHLDKLGKELRLLKREEEAIYLNYINKLNEIIKNDCHIEKYFFYWCTLRGMRYVDLLYDSTQTSEKEVSLLWLKNLFCCESHNELIRTTLTIRMNGAFDEFQKDSWKLKEIIAVPIQINIDENIVNLKFEQRRINVNDKQKVIIWGVGKAGQYAYYMLKKQNINQILLCDIDLLKQGGSVMDQVVRKPEEVITGDAFFLICINEKKYIDVKKWLLANDVCEENISLFRCLH